MGSNGRAIIYISIFSWTPSDRFRALKIFILHTSGQDRRGRFSASQSSAAETANAYVSVQPLKACREARSEHSFKI